VTYRKRVFHSARHRHYVNLLFKAPARLHRVCVIAAGTPCVVNFCLVWHVHVFSTV